MSSRLCLVALMLIGLITCSNFIYAEEVTVQLPLRIEAKSNHRDQQSGGIIFSLTNVSEKAIKINEIATPWGEAHRILLVAFEKKSGKTLRPLGSPIEDQFLIKSIVIAPGETITGIISLHQHFGNVERIRKKEGFLVFWHFRAIGQNGEALGEYGGWLNISNQDAQKK